MAAVLAEKHVPVSQALSTALTRINPGDGVGVVEFSCDADCYLVYSASLDDGGVLPSGRHRIPANVLYPIEIGALRPLVAAVSGTPTATFLGLSR